MSPPFKAAKGLLDFPLLPRESPHRDSHSLLRTWCGISTAHGEVVKRMTSPIKVVNLQSLYNVPWSFFAEGKEFQIHDIYDMVKKNRNPSRRRHVPSKTLPKNNTSKIQTSLPYTFLYTLQVVGSCWIYPDPQVTVSPRNATFEAIPFAPHRHQSTSDAAGVAQNTTARGASAERVLVAKKIMPNDSLISKYTRKNPTRFDL